MVEEGTAEEVLETEEEAEESEVVGEAAVVEGTEELKYKGRVRRESVSHSTVILPQFLPTVF